MITPSTAALALSVARNLIQLGNRLDQLRAEKIAVRSELVLTLPAVKIVHGPNLILPRLQDYLKRSSPAAPEPLTIDLRADLAAKIPAGYVYQAADLPRLREFHALAYPESESEIRTIVPDAKYLAYLREILPSHRDNLPGSPTEREERKLAAYQASLLAAAFAVDPGQDARELGYPLRVGLLVVDVLAEFGAEHSRLFIRDEGLRSVVQSVLERFSQPHLESFDQWSPFLRHALNATLNGVLEARKAWAGENPWLTATLGALVDARTVAGNKGDDYLYGLLHGKGYRLLVSQALPRAAALLDGESAPAFQRIIAAVLTSAQPLVAEDENDFGRFFSAHWPDLVNATLVAVEQREAELLDGKSPLVTGVLKSVLASLKSNVGQAKFVASDTLVAAVQAALGAASANPASWAVNDWGNAGKLVTSVLEIASQADLRKTFSPAGLSEILRQATTTVAAHPEWIVAEPGLLRDLVGDVLMSLKGLDSASANKIGAMLTSRILGAVAQRPALANSKLGPVVTDFATLLAKRVRAGTLGGTEASDLGAAVVDAVLLHPELLANADTQLAGKAVAAILAAADGDPRQLLAGATLTRAVRHVLGALAQYGAAVAVPAKIAELSPQLQTLVAAVLAQAHAKLGRGVTLAMLPELLGTLVRAWARGEAAAQDPTSAAFAALFDQLAAALPTPAA